MKSASHKIAASANEALEFVVEDDASKREAISSLIRSAGLRVSTFSSAKEYLLAQEPPKVPACLVLDVRLPGMSGLELQRELNGQPIKQFPSFL